MTSRIDNTLKKDANGTGSYTLRPATINEAYEIWSIMDTCFQALEHKEYFICDDLDYVKDILSGQGFAVVTCDEAGKIVGNLLVKYPGLTDENLGYDVSLSNKELCKVLHMDSSTVLPEHRGHRLEAKMITCCSRRWAGCPARYPPRCCTPR